VPARVLGHHWSSAITMTTPIIHKGATCGAKSGILTLLDMLVKPEIMAQFRPQMKKYYYDPTKYKSYLEQLGIQYPTLRVDQKGFVKSEAAKASEAAGNTTKKP
jgi:aminobenzoyl-glutamate utilization protein B